MLMLWPIRDIAVIGSCPMTSEIGEYTFAALKELGGKAMLTPDIYKTVKKLMAADGKTPKGKWHAHIRAAIQRDERIENTGRGEWAIKSGVDKTPSPTIAPKPVVVEPASTFVPTVPHDIKERTVEKSEGVRDFVYLPPAVFDEAPLEVLEAMLAQYVAGIGDWGNLAPEHRARLRTAIASRKEKKSAPMDQYGTFGEDVPTPFPYLPPIPMPQPPSPPQEPSTPDAELMTTLREYDAPGDDESPISPPRKWLAPGWIDGSVKPDPSKQWTSMIPEEGATAWFSSVDDVAPPRGYVETGKAKEIVERLKDVELSLDTDAVASPVPEDGLTERPNYVTGYRGRWLAPGWMQSPTASSPEQLGFAAMPGTLKGGESVKETVELDFLKSLRAEVKEYWDNTPDIREGLIRRVHGDPSLARKMFNDLPWNLRADIVEAVVEMLKHQYSAGTKSKTMEDVSKWICPECGRLRPDDERVLAGMKCAVCAYRDKYSALAEPEYEREFAQEEHISFIVDRIQTFKEMLENREISMTEFAERTEPLYDELEEFVPDHELVQARYDAPLKGQKVGALPLLGLGLVGVALGSLLIKALKGRGPGGA